MRVERPPARRQRGTGIVEFALVFPLIVALVLSILNGAWYVSASSATTNAAREGARYGVAGSHTCTAAGVTAAAGPRWDPSPVLRRSPPPADRMATAPTAG